MPIHELSRIDARRIAVRALLLDSSRPATLLDVRQLTLLQIDPTAAIAPSADLVAWSRLGSSYSPAELNMALENRTLLELRAMIRPSEDLALYRADMADWESAGPKLAGEAGDVHAAHMAAGLQIVLLGAASMAMSSDRDWRHIEASDSPARRRSKTIERHLDAGPWRCDPGPADCC